jgi:hypothetical protein
MNPPAFTDHGDGTAELVLIFDTAWSPAMPIFQLDGLKMGMTFPTTLLNANALMKMDVLMMIAKSATEEGK